MHIDEYNGSNVAFCSSSSILKALHADEYTSRHGTAVKKFNSISIVLCTLKGNELNTKKFDLDPGMSWNVSGLFGCGYMSRILSTSDGFHSQPVIRVKYNEEGSQEMNSEERQILWRRIMHASSPLFDTSGFALK